MTVVIIHNQIAPFLYTVRIEDERGWCEARNLPHKVALAYVALQYPTRLAKADE